MNRLTITGLSKAMSKKLDLAYALIKGQFSPAAEDIYQHGMLIAAQKNAKGKDRTILKAAIPQSQEALTKSARENSVLARLLEQMAKHPELDLNLVSSHKNTLST